MPPPNHGKGREKRQEKLVARLERHVEHSRRKVAHLEAKLDEARGVLLAAEEALAKAKEGQIVPGPEPEDEAI